ncbi:putative transmembrane protein [Rhizoctonia solani 123E]|uniref:Putative transmembrane protein n=1 Tax=Rhizoctonia solani 123E TaxID=1423351 RepID=A0A074RLZ5_9AGAM|nr:putative transmembrane protein [Rhizoctonia solani 123E]
MSDNSKLDDKFPPYFTKDPDATEPELVAKRREQWRHFSRDPYKPPRNDEKQGQSTEQAPESQKQEPTEYSRRLRHPGSGWTLLFYDLAWTATFATLSQNGTFIEAMDSVSYFGFFAAMMWLWASQTLYSVHFYTNDWFHLTSIFLQLIIFGLLAATTKGYYLTNFISRSPGSTELNSNADTISDEDELKRFDDERTDLFSAKAMALAFALTRFLHLIQYLRACYYARWGKGAETRGHTRRGLFFFDRVHPQVYAIIVGLIFSNMMLFAAVGIMFSSYGTSVQGASLKLGLWIGGFFLEILSHVWYPVLRLMASRRTEKETLQGQIERVPHWTEDVNPLPLAKVDLRERLDTITTIILGESINGFAGTLASILTLAGVGKAVGIHVASTAFTIWFIAYMYFEGPKSGSSPEGEGLRRLTWMVFYLPFLASIFLLFVGIKNQFLLTSFLSTLGKSFEELPTLLEQQNVAQRLIDSDSTLESDTIIKTFFFERKVIWKPHYQQLTDLFLNALNETDFQHQMGAWGARLSMTMVSKSYEALNGEESISEDIRPLITNYTTNFTASLEDARLSADPDVDWGKLEYYKILTQLLHGSFEGARYILAFAALIPICLGIQCIIHSLPRDRYQWGAITSRLVLGVILALLLLLNIGRYQEFFVSQSLEKQRAGVFLWLEAFWVLPTIAIAYALQFLAEIGLAYFAKKATEKARLADVQAKAEAGVRTSAMVIGGAAIVDQLASNLPQIPYTDPSSEQDDKRASVVD